VKLFNRGLSIFTLLICLGFAAGLILTDFLQPNLSETRRLMLILLLFVYAGIRSWRLYKDFNN
jgi:uncharacterized membrane protein YbjE (DUF340 family)